LKQAPIKITHLKGHFHHKVEGGGRCTRWRGGRVDKDKVGKERNRDKEK